MDTRTGTSGRAQPRASWALIPSDILGVVLRFLPCLSDRASLRSVCRPWRAAARLNPPLPLINLIDFTFTRFSPGGATSALRSIPLPKVAAHDHVRCAGAFEGWLVGVLSCRHMDEACFLLNPFSQAMIHLPTPTPYDFDCSGSIRKSVPVINSSGDVTYSINSREYSMFLCKVVLSCSPDSGSECIVAAISEDWNKSRLALWQTGMTSWCVCDGDCITSSSDLVFYQGNLYLLNKYTTDLYAFELGEHDDGMLVISRVERCITKPLPPLPFDDWITRRCKLVEWHGKLLIIRHCEDFRASYKTYAIDVLALDFSTNPYGCKKIKTLDGESIFVSWCCSKSFPACQYDGVEEDHIYFIDEFLHPNGEDNASFNVPTYSMRDGTVGSITIMGSERRHVSPMWFFPS